MKYAVTLLMALALSGCGCTSSYPLSLVTCGVGYQYCPSNIFGRRCMTANGHDDSGCGCSESCGCRGAKAKGSK